VATPWHDTWQWKSCLYNWMVLTILRNIGLMGWVGRL
jgi:hypothetical protein